MSALIHARFHQKLILTNTHVHLCAQYLTQGLEKPICMCPATAPFLQVNKYRQVQPWLNQKLDVALKQTFMKLKQHLNFVPHLPSASSRLFSPTKSSLRATQERFRRTRGSLKTLTQVTNQNKHENFNLYSLFLSPGARNRPQH